MLPAILSIGSNFKPPADFHIRYIYKKWNNL